MPTIRVKRHNELDLVFEGELIAEATSDEEGKLRWQTLRLYRTDGGRYVLERLGESRVEGDLTMRYVDKLDTPADVLRRVQRKRDDGSKYLTIVALQLLDEAVEHDPAFADVAAERIQ